MIRIAGPFPADPPAWHHGFLAMLPYILNHARIAFRHLRPEARQEAVQEVVCNAMVAYAALVKRGKVALAYPSVLARYAVAQTRDHRKVGGGISTARTFLAVLPTAQGHRRRAVGPCTTTRTTNGSRPSSKTTTRPSSTRSLSAVTSPHGWTSLPRRNRRIAEALAAGQNTGDVAERFNLSAGRISQLRRELHRSWQSSSARNSHRRTWMTRPDGQLIQPIACKGNSTEYNAAGFVADRNHSSRQLGKWAKLSPFNPSTEGGHHAKEKVRPIHEIRFGRIKPRFWGK